MASSNFLRAASVLPLVAALSACHVAGSSALKASGPAPDQSETTACAKPWLFYDLGENTILNTDGRFPASDPHGDLVDVHYMVGAKAYLADLKAKGYHLGLMVNVPAPWDLSEITNYLTRPPGDQGPQDPGGWTPGADLLDMSQFDTILLTNDASCRASGTIPLDQSCRKPQHLAPPFAKGELWLYRQAMAMVPAGCQAILQTGIKEEIKAAEAAGMAALLHPPSTTGIALLKEAEFAPFLASQAATIASAVAFQASQEQVFAAQGREIPRSADPSPTE